MPESPDQKTPESSIVKAQNPKWRKPGQFNTKLDFDGETVVNGLVRKYPGWTYLAILKKIGNSDLKREHEQTSITSFALPENSPEGTTFKRIGGQWVNKTGSTEITQTKVELDKEHGGREERALNIQERGEVLRSRAADDKHKKDELEIGIKEIRQTRELGDLLESTGWKKLQDQSSREFKRLAKINPEIAKGFQSSQAKRYQKTIDEQASELYHLRPLEARLAASDAKLQEAQDTNRDQAHRLQDLTKQNLNARLAGTFLVDLSKELLDVAASSMGEEEARQFIARIQKEVSDWVKLNGPGSSSW